MIISQGAFVECTVNERLYADVQTLPSCLVSPPPCILCFSETWLENSDNNVRFLPPGYNGVLSSSRINRRRGQSMIQQFVLVMNLYVPPRMDKTSFLSILNKEMESFTKPKHPIIITGVVNIDISKSKKPTKDYHSTLAGYGFHLTYIVPARVSAETSSRIDHFTVKNIDEVKVKTLVDCFFDHFPLLLDFSILSNV